MRPKPPETGFSFRLAWRAFRSDHWSLAIWILFSLVLVVFTFSRHRNTTNTRSRMITVERLVEKGTFAHVAPGDTTPFNTSIDAIMIEGKLYSSKPPTYPMLMAGQAWLIRQVSGKSFYEGQKTQFRLLTLINQVIPYSVMMFLVWCLTWLHTQRRETLIAVMLAISIGSLAYGYAVTINNHALSAVCFTSAFVLTWLAYYRNYQPVWLYLVTGFLIGYGGANDLTALGFTAVLGLFLLLSNWKKALLAAVMALIPLVATEIYYFIMSGSPLPFYMQENLYDYAGSAWNGMGELDLNNQERDAKWLYLFHITLGHHGIFSLSPILILGVVGVWRLLKNKSAPGRALIAGMTIAFTLTFLYVLLRTYNYGGYCIGIRWCIVGMPFLAWAGWPVYERLMDRVVGKLIIGLLILLSAIPVIQALYWEAFIISVYEKWMSGF